MIYFADELVHTRTPLIAVQWTDPDTSRIAHTVAFHLPERFQGRKLSSAMLDYPPSHLVTAAKAEAGSYSGPVAADALADMERMRCSARLIAGGAHELVDSGEYPKSFVGLRTSRLDGWTLSLASEGPGAALAMATRGAERFSFEVDDPGYTFNAMKLELTKRESQIRQERPPVLWYTDSHDAKKSRNISLSVDVSEGDKTCMEIRASWESADKTYMESRKFTEALGVASRLGYPMPAWCAYIDEDMMPGIGRSLEMAGLAYPAVFPKGPAERQSGVLEFEASVFSDGEKTYRMYVFDNQALAKMDPTGARRYERSRSYALEKMARSFQFGFASKAEMKERDLDSYIDKYDASMEVSRTGGAIDAETIRPVVSLPKGHFEYRFGEEHSFSITERLVQVGSSRADSDLTGAREASETRGELNSQWRSYVQATIPAGTIIENGIDGAPQDIGGYAFEVCVPRDSCRKANGEITKTWYRDELVHLTKAGERPLSVPASWLVEAEQRRLSAAAPDTPINSIAENLRQAQDIKAAAKDTENRRHGR